MAIYECKKRAINCHYGDVVCYEGEMNRRKDYWKRDKKNLEAKQ